MSDDLNSHPMPGRFDAFYERHREHLMRWLGENKTHEIKVLVPTGSDFEQHTLRRTKAALVYAGHRYWWWTATDDLGRSIAGKWYLDD